MDIHFSTITQRILDCVSQKKSLSLIRIGDGDALILGWRSHRRNPKIWPVVQRQLLTWFGRYDFSHRELDQMRSLLCRAASRADILGIPELTDRGLWSEARKQIDQANLVQPNHTIVTHNCHLELHCTGGLQRICSAADRITLVTCRSQLVDRLKSLTGKQVDLIEVPAETRTESRAYGRRDTRHWERHPEFRRRCFAIKTGLVLVGAGLLGKIYTTDAARGGAVALDIGSVFDGWAGLCTRGHIRKDSTKYALGPTTNELP